MPEGFDEQIEGLHEQVGQFYAQGSYDQAIDAAFHMRDLARQHLGEHDPVFATSLNNLALLYKVTHQYRAAEELYQQALAVYRTSCGEQSEEVATGLNNLASLYLAQGRYREAEPLFTQALDLTCKLFGAESAEMAGSVNNLAALYEAQGRYGEAEPLFEQALNLTQAAYGAEGAEAAGSLNNLAAVYEAQGRYREAEPLFTQALTIYRQLLPSDHPYIAVTLQNLGRLYQALERYGAAEQLYRQILAIQQGRKAAEHAEVATSLQFLADLATTRGQYQEAQKGYQQSLEIRRRLLGSDHPTVATSLSSLAGLYHIMGDDSVALDLARQALTIRQARLGAEHPDVATSLQQLGRIHYALGDFAAALPLYQRALTIRRASLGDRHPRYADTLSSMAGLYRAAGDYDAARPLYREALDIQSAALGQESLAYATTLNDFGLLHYWTGTHHDAQQCFEQALTIRRNALGPEHVEVAHLLHNLAAVYRVTGKYAAAEQLLQETTALYRDTIGEHHADYAASLSNLASLAKTKGDIGRAETLLQQALATFRQTLGEQHPYVAATLHNLAGVCVALDKADEAFALLNQATAINDQIMSQIFSIGSERQRMAHLLDLQAHVNVFLSFLLQHPTPEHVHQAYGLVLRRKGIAAEALAIQRDTILGGRYPDLSPKLQGLGSLRMQIARMNLGRTGHEDQASLEQHLAALNERREALESDLVRAIPEMNLQQQLQQADLPALIAALPPAAALVEFVRCEVFNFGAVLARGDPRWKSARYLAFVLCAGEPEQVQLVDLGEAAVIDQLIEAWRATIGSGGRNLRPIVSRLENAASLGERLRAAAFDPLRAALGERTRLFLAPDGNLCRLPFEALPTDDGHHLIETHQISYLGVGRDLLRFGKPVLAQLTEPLVVADPNFDLGGDSAVLGGMIHSEHWRHSGELNRAGLHFTRLPGTRAEGEQIAALLKVQPVLADAALESRLKACRSPRVLHLATHGFFFEDQPHGLNSDPTSPGQSEVLAEYSFGRLAFALESPLLRSGLALAGANTWLKGGSLPPDAEDAILSAEDVSGLDLFDTELVVLSACETGLGAIQVGEGVLGLRRAFVLAGARTLVMSLWQVPDQQTQELMVDFYRRILAGEPRAEALRAAQLALRARHPSPYYWSAFICQGDPERVRPC